MRDIELTDEQMQRLRERSGSNGVGREKFSQTMRRKRAEKIAAYRRDADEQCCIPAYPATTS